MRFEESLARARRMNRLFPNSVKSQGVYPSVDSGTDTDRAPAIGRAAVHGLPQRDGIPEVHRPRR